MLAIAVAAILGRTLTESFHVPIVMTGLGVLLIVAVRRKATAFDFVFLVAVVLVALAVTFLTILATLQ